MFGNKYESVLKLSRRIFLYCVVCLTVFYFTKEPQRCTAKNWDVSLPARLPDLNPWDFCVYAHLYIKNINKPII